MALLFIMSDAKIHYSKMGDSYIELQLRPVYTTSSGLKIGEPHTGIPFEHFDEWHSVPWLFKETQIWDDDEDSIISEYWGDHYWTPNEIPIGKWVIMDTFLNY